jgi:hypothetical protein
MQGHQTTKQSVRYKRHQINFTDTVSVFMTNPDPTEFPKYPICKVSTSVIRFIFQMDPNFITKIGDFGSARITHVTDINNPFWNDPVTHGYIAPEIDHPNTYDHKFWEIGTATNVSCISRA